MANKVANRIRQLRGKLGLSQRDLARILDVRQATISGWETGEATPSRGNLRLLADLCHDSRLVYRWLSGEGVRPRLQPYRSDHKERASAAATYGFEDETKAGRAPGHIAEELTGTLETARGLVGELERNLGEAAEGPYCRVRHAVLAASQALDAAYHALTVVRAVLREEDSDKG